jgi:hypothetical protein
MRRQKWQPTRTHNAPVGGSNPSSATNTIDDLDAVSAFLAFEKFPDQPRHALRLLEMRHMPRAGQHRDACVGDTRGEFIGRRDDGPAAAYSFSR